MDETRTPPEGRPSPSEREAEEGARAAHLGFVAHEIRNPLSTALWTSELMVRLAPAERSGARGEKLAGLCLRAVARVRLLIEDHLLCERLDAGGYPVRPERLALAELLGAVVSRMPADHPPVEQAVPAGAAVLADRLLLERALDGLLGTAAWDATGLRVEVTQAGDSVQITVAGGPPGSLEDPRKGAPSDQRGRALSLPMARRVAAVLGGSLTVDGRGYVLAIPAA